MVPSNPQHCIQGQGVGAYRAGTRVCCVSVLLETHMPAESVAQRRETSTGLGGVNLNSKRSSFSP